MIHLVIYARASDKLRYDNSLGSVDHECTACSHKRQLAHVYVVFYDRVRSRHTVAFFIVGSFFVDKLSFNKKRRRVCSVTLLALDHGTLEVLCVNRIIGKIKYQCTRMVLDTRYILQYLLEAYIHKPFKGLLLDLDKIGHTDDFIDLAEAHTGRFT